MSQNESIRIKENDRYRKPFTLEELTQIKYLISKGFNYTEIGFKLNRSSQFIGRLIKRNGGVKYFDPFTEYERAKKIKKDADKKRRIRNTIQLSKEQIILLDEGIKNNKSINQLHKDLKCGWHALYCWMKKHRRDYFNKCLGELMHERISALEMQIKILSDTIKTLSKKIKETHE